MFLFFGVSRRRSLRSGRLFSSFGGVGRGASFGAAEIGVKVHNKIRTHYDNLKVPRDASAEEIRAQYRRLSKKYHPDLNDSPDAARIMSIINKAYEVLSDPAKRAEHDRWIGDQERMREIRGRMGQFPGPGPGPGAPGFGAPPPPPFGAAPQPTFWDDEFSALWGEESKKSGPSAKKIAAALLGAVALAAVASTLIIYLLSLGGEEEPAPAAAPVDLDAQAPLAASPGMSDAAVRGLNPGYTGGAAYALPFPQVRVQGGWALRADNESGEPMFVILRQSDPQALRAAPSPSLDPSPPFALERIAGGSAGSGSDTLGANLSSGETARGANGAAPPGAGEPSGPFVDGFSAEAPAPELAQAVDKTAQAARVFYMPPGASATMGQLPSGRYVALSYGASGGQWQEAAVVEVGPGAPDARLVLGPAP